MSMESVEVLADIGTWRIEAEASFSRRTPLNYSVTRMSARPYAEDGSLGQPLGFEALRDMDDADMRSFESVIDKAISRATLANLGPDTAWHERADAWRSAREWR